jgi:electron transport complex protein RnfG
MSREPLLPRLKGRLGYHAVLLGLMALTASALLVIGDAQTKADIAARQAEDLLASLSQVVPAGVHDNDLLRDTVTIAVADGSGPTRQQVVYRARHGDEITALAFRTTAQGYGGEISLVLGVDPAGKLLGVRIISHQETPGLGDRIEAAKSNWVLSFTGHSLSDPDPAHWGVKKDGGAFDQFSGATITPLAVVKAIKAGLELYARHRTELLADTSPATAATGAARHE